MKHIFYFLSFFPIMWELYVVQNHIFVSAQYNAMKDKKYKNLSGNERVMVWGMLFYMLWWFVGLFSGQWILFVLLFIVSVMIPKTKPGWLLLDAVITILILFAILFNEYHFHINLWHLIVK